MYCDLHNHLYGSLSAQRLYDIGRKNSNPKWSIFTESYEKAYGRKINPANFFDEFDSVEKFAKLYYFNHRGPFPEFQAKFDLIIALVPFTFEEMQEIASQITLDHARQNVTHAEYRIMFSALEERESFERRIISVCAGLEEGENLAQKERHIIRAEAILSLHRNHNTWENYIWLKDLMAKNSMVRGRITGIDFCHIEEGSPPKTKKEFFAKVHQDNLADPASALSILYHVAESYQDKTPFSASRWVWESVHYGAHRLGHCIALGVDPKYFAETTRSESVSERIDQYKWELEYYDEIVTLGDYYTKSEIESNLQKCLNASSTDTKVEVTFHERNLLYLNTLQESILNRVKNSQSVIESCPSSNYYIGMIHNPSEHPLKRFIKNGVKVTIGTDDPGIFNTTMKEEYIKAEQMKISELELEMIRKNSFQYKSSILSGRLKSG